MQKSSFSEEKIKDYIEKDCECCPFCGSYELHSKDASSTGTNIYRDVECEECEREFTEIAVITMIIKK